MLPAKAQGAGVVLDAAFPAHANLASGDYYLRPAGAPETALRRITGLSGTGLTLESPLADGLPAKGGRWICGASVASLRGRRQVYRLRHVRA